MKYLTYQDLDYRIRSMSVIGRDVSYLIFTLNEILILNMSNTVCYNLITMEEIDLDCVRTPIILDRGNCKIYRGGWRSLKLYHTLNIPYRYKDHDIIDLWEYTELIKYPEIINQILISRLSYAGNPSETDKFQGFWMSDVRFLYPTE